MHILIFLYIYIHNCIFLYICNIITYHENQCIYFVCVFYLSMVWKIKGKNHENSLL